MSDELLRYRWLDLLPERLVQPVVTHAHGDLIPRGKSVLIARESLLEGKPPRAPELSWPEPELRGPLCEAIEASKVAPYCEDDPELTDEILDFFIHATEEAHNVYDRALVAFLTLSRERDDDHEGGACSGPGGEGGELPGKRPKPTLKIGDKELERLRDDALQICCQLLAVRGREWGERVEVFASFDRLFEQLTASLHLPPGTGRGMLRSLPRTDMLRLRELLDGLPALAEVIRQLGRMQESDDPDAPSVLEQLGQVVRRSSEAIRRDVIAPHGVEVRGIERSGDVERMLPSEAVLLMNPTLRLLWQARRVERGLLAYHAPGVHTKRIQEQQCFEDGTETQQRRADRGPIIVLLDSSGSMFGQVETIAKALTVQIASVAFVEKRPCYLYNFSGPGEILEAQISFEGDGLTAMLGVISASFHGGTLLDESLRRVCRRITQRGWSQADVAVLSDGEFYASQASIEAVRLARFKSAVRFHGVCIGRELRPGGFPRLGCDSVLMLRDLAGDLKGIRCHKV